MSRRWKTRKKNGILADQRRSAFLATDEKLAALTECIKSNDHKRFLELIQESVDKEIEFRENGYQDEPIKHAETQKEGG